MNQQKDVPGIDIGKPTPTDYSQFLVKEFRYWSLYINENQSYLGRCYLWCKREDALDLPDATLQEWYELHGLIRRIELVLTKSFQPDMLNYAFLGNINHHLHGHIIPRYSRSVQFEGITFEDKQWGRNYQTDTDFITSPHVLAVVIKKLGEAFA